MDEKKTRYRKYTEEFKLEALELLKSSGKSAGQIERDLGITPGLTSVMAISQVIRGREAHSLWRQAIWKREA